MSWNAKKSQSERFPITTNGKKTLVPVSQISEMIKQRLKRSPSIHSLFDEFDMDISQLDNLVIEIVPLEKKYAETDSNSIRLNTMLFDKGNFFDNYFFVVPHELVHWLSRKKENDSYFNDPEEVLGFVLSVAHELESHGDIDIAWNRVYPKINWHFHNESDAKNFFQEMLKRAKEFIDKGKSQNNMGAEYER